MSSIEERLQIKREPLDKWSIREQLCLAAARIHDQNLTSVSRALKPFGEANRPGDWFNQKNCAAQYGALLANVETPKRKKRTSGTEMVMETPAEAILRRLLSERSVELKKLMAEEKAEYLKLQEDMALLQAGNISEEQLDTWCREIDEEEQKREQEQLTHSQWLRERELRKQEIERAWRPAKPLNLMGQKRKNSESIDNLMDSAEQSIVAVEDLQKTPTHQSEQSKPALSPLLTSLLKSPSQSPNVATSSILHSAITNTNQRVTIASTSNTNPMIASLLSSSPAPAAVSPGIQQLVSTAIGQEAGGEDVSNVTTTDILDDANLPMLKIDDLANSILIQNGPLPEMKNDVDVIISDLIENAQDIVADPEQHLQLDGNGDINISLELDDFEEEMDKEIVETTTTTTDLPSSSNNDDATATTIITEEHGTTTIDKESTTKEIVVEKIVDPFEFQEDPEVYQPATIKNPSIVNIKQSTITPNPEIQSEELVVDTVELTATPTINDDSLDAGNRNNKLEDIFDEPKNDTVEVEDIKQQDPLPEEVKKEKTPVPGSVEIVEVVVMDDDDIDKELNKAQIEDIVQTSFKIEKEVEESYKEDQESSEDNSVIIEPVKEEEEKIIESTVFVNSPQDKIVDTKEDSVDNKDVDNSLIESKSTVTATAPDFPEDIYDDAHMEVRIYKTGKAKRDYSRTKKKDEKEFDVLLALEKSHQDLCNETIMEDLSDRDSSHETKDKSIIKQLKQEYDGGSCTSWDDDDAKSSKRRLSTPATFVDSVPDSPSSSIYDDDRDYKAWKKSVMLVYNRLSTNKYASLFSKPITDEQVPGYRGIVYRPMDLQTIRRNVESGVIRTTHEFQRDVLLMLNNAVMYNKTNESVYNMAREMQQEAVQEIEIFVQAQMQQGDAPVRRETRTSEPGAKRKRGNEEAGRASKKRKED